MKFKIWLENKNYGIQLVKLFEKGVNTQDASILGFHGTSIFSIKYMLQHGVLPVGNPIAGNVNRTNEYNSIYCMPNPLNKIVQNIKFRRRIEENPYKTAKDFASSISDRHNQLKYYDLDFNNPDHVYFAMSGENPPSNIKRLNYKSNNQEFQKGFVLSIKESVAKQYEVDMGDDGDDIKIVVGDHLPIDYIDGIEPMGDREYEWFEDLQNQLLNVV